MRTEDKCIFVNGVVVNDVFMNHVFMNHGASTGVSSKKRNRRQVGSTDAGSML